MKRCIIASKNPAQLIEKYYLDYSIMVVNPNAPFKRYQFLLENSDYSLLVTDHGYQVRDDGGDYNDERAYWYTSGTTGDSKFCSFRWKQIDHVARTIQEAYN